MITGVGDEHMGRFILGQLAREGVNTDGVKTDPDRLTALVLLEIAVARGRDIPSVIVIDNGPYPGTGIGRYWWDVAVPEVSDRSEVRRAREAYVKQTARQRVD